MIPQARVHADRQTYTLKQWFHTQGCRKTDKWDSNPGSSALEADALPLANEAVKAQSMHFYDQRRKRNIPCELVLNATVKITEINGMILSVLLFNRPIQLSELLRYKQNLSKRKLIQCSSTSLIYTTMHDSFLKNTQATQ